MRRRSLAVPLVLALALAACSSGDDDAAGSQTTAATTEAPATATTTSPTTAPAAAQPETTPPTTAPATTTPPSTAAPSPWTPVGVGEFDVGVTTVIVGDPADVRPLTVDVWFPLAADADVDTLAPQQYTLLPDVYYESPAAFAADASLIAEVAPVPLVVYSHGSGGIRYLHSSYTEALASHGYVVVAPDHTGNTVFDRFTGDGSAPETVFNRPDDVRRVIDAFVEPLHPTAGAFAARVDPEKVAVTGHSFGGYTAVAVTTGVSTGFGDVPADPRVGAIVPLAPAVSGRLLDDELIASLGVPMMVVVGTDDTTTPVDPNVTRLWDLTSSTPAYRVELVAGEHQTFTDLCAYGDFLPALTDVPAIVVELIDELGAEGCSPGDIDDARAAELTNSYVIRFLDEVFRDGPAIDSTSVATPDDVLFDRR